jgi:hypothetical protein
MAKKALAFLVLNVVATTFVDVPAFGRPLDDSSYVPAETKSNAGPRFRWGAGLRAQTFYTNQAWTELGADAVVFPWQHLGLGVTAFQGAGVSSTACDSTPTQPCGPYWRSIAPFTEFRLLPNVWISPYARGSLGVAWGNFSRLTVQPSSVAVDAHEDP